jgi:hypothetical protein
LWRLSIGPRFQSRSLRTLANDFWRNCRPLPRKNKRHGSRITGGDLDVVTSSGCGLAGMVPAIEVSLGNAGAGWFAVGGGCSLVPEPSAAALAGFGLLCASSVTRARGAQKVAQKGPIKNTSDKLKELM